MTRYNCEAAPLATLLLVVVMVMMVGVASAVAKPSPYSYSSSSTPSIDSMSSSSSSSSNHNQSIDDYYYYYDEFEYDDYEEEEGEGVGEGPPLMTLNMSDFHLPGEGEVEAPHVPRYMLELYADQTSRSPQLHQPPSKNELVRSFIADSLDASESEDEEEEKEEDEKKKEAAVSGGTARIHSLSFNITLPRREKITSATLRLYALITRDQFTYIGVERRVRIVMALHNETGVNEEEVVVPHVTVCARDVYQIQNTWETFDVTTAVKYWLSHPSLPQILQIHIESVFSTAGDGGDLDVATVPRTDSEPLLLVYSTASPHQMAKRELKLMISHEYDDEIPNSQRRRKRSTNKSRRRSRTRRSVAEEQEEESNRIFEGDTLFPDLPNHALRSLEVFTLKSTFDLPPGRRRPAGRKRRAKNSCKRKPLKVDFKDIGWDKWIIAPPSYEAYQCSGKCFYPLASHLSPTKHAVVQNLVHSLHPDRASRACCVPTKLGPISLLYVENGTPTYEYGYNDMVVLQCGCR